MKQLLFVLQPVIHYGLHFAAPGLIAWGIVQNTRWTQKSWKNTWLVLLATMLVDLDHLLATPIFDPGRCSIGFHPLHSYYAIGAYFVLLLPAKTRIVAIGLLFHMFTDRLDCWMQNW